MQHRVVIDRRWIPTLPLLVAAVSSVSPALLLSALSSLVHPGLLF